MTTLQGRTIFITGASRGIGRAIALRCARDGANIVIASKTSDPHPHLPGTIHTVAAEVEEAGGAALAQVLDVRNVALVAERLEQAAAHFGGIDAVINNAGAITLTPAEHTPMKRVDLMFQINVRAAYACASAAIPWLKKNGGHIVNMSPPIDLDPRWFANYTAYTISKYGMSMCTIGLAAELGKYGISVNSLWPQTVIDTSALRRFGGAETAKHGRTPEIMADATWAILTTPPSELTGQCLIDEKVLATRGITDLERYRVDPDSELINDLYLSD